MKMRVLILAVLLFLSALPLSAQGGAKEQEDRDSLVRLITADRARLIEINGKEYRKVVGNAVFLHNDTYLYCDSAYWNVDDEFIDAIGSVRIEQENTVLTGDSIKYVIPQNTAKFRGHLVELIDRDSNVLRTNYLDYNTRDSVAFFYRGGAMKDHDGNLIESLTGRYQSREERFDFVGEVEMFSDSIFFVCDTLVYDAAADAAYFYGNTKGWYDLNGISSGSGKYIRPQERFYFYSDVHILMEEYEMWCDSLFYDRFDGYSLMQGNVQLLDTVDNVIALAGELRYWNDPRRAELYRDPALVMIEESADGNDSTFMASDKIFYYTMRMCDVDSAVVAAAKDRYGEALVDPLANRRQSQSSSPRGTSGGIGGASQAGNFQGASSRGTMSRPGAMSPGTLPSPYYPPQDTVQTAPGGRLPKMGISAPDSSAIPDSLGIHGLQVPGAVHAPDSSAVPGKMSVPAQVPVPDTLALPDSLAAPDSLSAADSVALPPPPDTTSVAFIEAHRHVRIFKNDMQVKCDSLIFTSIDSIARLFDSPVIWYGIESQITSDSMQFMIRNETLDRGFLFGNAFVISEEVPGKYYHQIKSPEMIGYFKNGEVSRFDALGGVTAIFYIAEDSLITTMNQKECRLMTGRLKDGQVQRILYMENIKSDAYPLYELTPEMSRLRDFFWIPEQRPVNRFQVTWRSVRSSRRAESVPSPDFPRFRYAEKYFEGYMSGIIQEIDSRKPLIWMER